MVEEGRSKQEALFLPPGFRFHPTDEEIITRYLMEKFSDPRFSAKAVGEVDLNKCEPWDLPSKAKMGEREWYFFCQKDMKYPTGMRANRATKAGYWKATGKDKEIFRGKGVLVGMKKTLVFYEGRAPKGLKTNWVMHEFRLEGKPKEHLNLHVNPKDEWVVCKVFHKKGAGAGKKPAMAGAGVPRVSSVNSVGVDDFINSLIDPACFSGHSLGVGLEDPTTRKAASTTNSLPNCTNQAMTSSTGTTSQGSSWNALQGYWNQEQYRATTAKGPPSSAVGTSRGPDVAGALQQKMAGYGSSPYAAFYLTGSGAAPAVPANYFGY